MSVDTARVTRPHTGFPFLDAGRDEGGVLAFAHRGGAHHPDLAGLENTLAAFDHAVKLGYRYLETDVHLTRDGVLLAFHDDRPRPGHRPDRLDRRHVVRRPGRRPDRRPRGDPADGRPARPLPRAPASTSTSSPTSPWPALADLVERTSAHDRVCIGSFSEARLRRFRRLVSRPVATSFGPVGVGVSRFTPGALAERLLRGRGDALQVPHRLPDRLGGATVVNERFVRRAHDRGRPVHVWTVDDPDEMRDLLDLGVDGLMTDRTDVLRDVLVARGQWMGATP